MTYPLSRHQRPAPVVLAPASSGCDRRVSAGDHESAGSAERKAAGRSCFGGDGRASLGADPSSRPGQCPTGDHVAPNPWSRRAACKLSTNSVASTCSKAAWRNWQTRWTQNPVLARVCGFDPLRRHLSAKVAFALPTRWLGTQASVTHDQERCAGTRKPCLLLRASRRPERSDTPSGRRHALLTRRGLCWAEHGSPRYRRRTPAGSADKIAAIMRHGAVRAYVCS